MIYICVLNYKNPEDTIACCESLLQLHQKEFQILLIDNASPDDSQRMLTNYVKANSSNIIFFPLKKNIGYAGGNNVALRYAMNQSDFEYAWILNNDTLVAPDSLTWLITYMENNPEVGICGSKLIYEWDHNKLQGYGGKYNPYIGTTRTCRDIKDIKNIDYVIGASVFVRPSFLKQVGLMSEDYFLYYEELDWAMRARGKFLIGCEPRSIVYHKEGAAVGSDTLHPESKSELADYYGMRNRLQFARKFFPRYLPIIYLSTVGILWNRFQRHQYKRIWLCLKLLLGIKDKRFEK